jgi:arginase
MPLAMLVGRGDQEILRGLKMQPLDEAGIVLCDARDLDPLERDAVSSSRVVHLTSTQQLDALDFGSSPVHLHIDPDVLDPTEAPAMLYPAAGGPGIDALAQVLARLTSRARVMSVSLTAWALDRDGAGKTEAAVWRLLGAAIGEPVGSAQSWRG